jgi:enoyl-CoA hydratase/carnithine racemase
MTITLNRPESGNVVSNAMGGEIVGLLESAGDAKVIVLRGAGKDFCLGRDIAALKAAGPLKTVVDYRAGNTTPALALFGSFRRVRQPVIAVVQGKAIGLGCGLAGVCDITIAADDTQYQLPEMDHGIPPCLAMSALLGTLSPKAIGYLVYTCETIDAARARELGLISKVVPAAELQREADALIKRIAGYSAPAVPAVKEYLRSAPRMDLQGAADFGANLIAGVMTSAAGH